MSCCSVVVVFTNNVCRDRLQRLYWKYCWRLLGYLASVCVSRWRCSSAK